MVSADTLRIHFERGLGFGQYVATGSAARQESWRAAHGQARMSEAQRALVASFTRRMPVLVLSGTWCGDCVQQGPMLARIAEANPLIDLRFVDRDEHIDLADQVRICGGHRVPTVVFMAEDYEFVSLLGDRTLSRYRAIAARQLGPSCPLPGAAVPPEEMEATMQDWVNEFERVHLILRLSPRLREKHGD